jgi:hypothetical protein
MPSLSAVRMSMATQETKKKDNAQAQSTLRFAREIEERFLASLGMTN